METSLLETSMRRIARRCVMCVVCVIPLTVDGRKVAMPKQQSWPRRTSGDTDRGAVLMQNMTPGKKGMTHYHTYNIRTEIPNSNSGRRERRNRGKILKQWELEAHSRRHSQGQGRRRPVHLPMCKLTSTVRLRWPSRTGKFTVRASDCGRVALRLTWIFRGLIQYRRMVWKAIGCWLPPRQRIGAGLHFRGYRGLHWERQRCRTVTRVDCKHPDRRASQTKQGNSLRSS